MASTSPIDKVAMINDSLSRAWYRGIADSSDHCHSLCHHDCWDRGRIAL